VFFCSFGGRWCILAVVIECEYQHKQQTSHPVPARFGTILSTEHGPCRAANPRVIQCDPAQAHPPRPNAPSAKPQFSRANLCERAPPNTTTSTTSSAATMSRPEDILYFSLALRNLQQNH
jgi:hypothetical protein